jgi:hypothetical protein
MYEYKRHLHPSTLITDKPLFSHECIHFVFLGIAKGSAPATGHVPESVRFAFRSCNLPQDLSERHPPTSYLILQVDFS